MEEENYQKLYNMFFYNIDMINISISFFSIFIIIGHITSAYSLRDVILMIEEWYYSGGIDLWLVFFHE